jgi:MIP family channel proteins
MVSIKKYLAEFIGTFALVFIAAGSAVVNHITGGMLGLLGMAVATGLVVMAMVYALGNISGAHINPAVTISMFVAKRANFKDTILYISSQLAGASFAGLLLWNMFPKAIAGMNLGTTSLGANVSFSTGILIEIILTFMLVATIFITAIDSRTPSGIAGFAIGMIIIINILLGGSITGASMNPARSFGPALVSGYWINHMIYWIGPFMGGIVAAWMYENILAHKNLLNIKHKEGN